MYLLANYNHSNGDRPSWKIQVLKCFGIHVTISLQSILVYHMLFLKVQYSIVYLFLKEIRLIQAPQDSVHPRELFQSLVVCQFKYYVNCTEYTPTPFYIPNATLSGLAALNMAKSFNCIPSLGTSF